MKKLFLSLIAMMIATVGFAQGSLLATLSHEGQISAYYGASALGQALEAADNGDVITLSSGQFNAANITKAVTLRGAGMSVSTDSLNSHEATIIQGDYTINLSDALQGRLTMEGLYFNGGTTYSGALNNAQFLKCRFYNFVSASNAKITNSSFIHCRITRICTFAANSNAYFINSILCCPSNPSSSNLEMDNCIVKWDYESDSGHDGPEDVSNSYYKNCILQTAGGGGEIPSSCVAYNCIGLGNSRIFANILSKNNTNKYVSSVADVFKTYRATSSGTHITDSETFELTDEAKTKYLGTDGTQVGLYGGNLVYDENPTTPQITKCNVASKSTADGKLSVDIEVKAAEY